MVTTGKLMGRKVISEDAFTLGEVAGAEVDTRSWQITHMHVKLTDEATRELGFKKPFLGHLTVCLPVTLVKAFGDVVTLGNALQELKEVPECKHG
ncbi:MAG: hypothetical protein NWE77_00265 [Candidatus Bathyarchaeota archaeon]|nr:hypothetical protein [Candidatus Bathyarchaeota archaeon]UCC27521.1 MAG: hypothetical protein JSW29_05450 [Candidatus Bathyarchaeota archaeon]